jgi:tetratricopeptide (TPR) repeat protein
MRKARIITNGCCAAVGLAVFYFSYSDFAWFKGNFFVSFGFGAFSYYVAFFAIVIGISIVNKEYIDKLDAQSKQTEANLPPIESKHLRSNFVPLGKVTDNKADIRKKIWDCVGPNCIRLSTPEEVISLGQDAVPVAIDILKSFDTVNQAVLTIALRQFASQGNEQASQALYDIAAGKIPVYPQSFGDVAFTQAQEYVAEKRGSSPTTLWGEASRLDKAKQFDKAIDKYKEYLALVPNDLNVRVAIGCMYQKLGKFPDAISWWEEALSKGLQFPLAGSVNRFIEEAKAKLSQGSK